MISNSLYVVFKTLHLASKQFFIGIHATSDPWFATPLATDAHMGYNDHLTKLIRQDGRKAFAMQQLHVGSEVTARAAYNGVLRNSLANPLCLNAQVGAPAGVPKTPEHKAKIAESTAKAMKDNINSVGAGVAGNPQALPEGFTRKWINNGKIEKFIVVERGVNTPLPIEYEGFQVGKLKKAK